MSNQARTLAALHADLIRASDRRTRSAARMAAEGDLNRADMARDEAAELREQANALAEVLAPLGVHVPDPRQLSLLSLGDQT